MDVDISGSATDDLMMVSRVHGLAGQAGQIQHQMDISPSIITD